MRRRRGRARHRATVAACSLGWCRTERICRSSRQRTTELGHIDFFVVVEIVILVVYIAAAHQAHPNVEEILFSTLGARGVHFTRRGGDRGR
jgi:hypothetical protein